MANSKGRPAGGSPESGAADAAMVRDEIASGKRDATTGELKSTTPKLGWNPYIIKEVDHHGLCGEDAITILWEDQSGKTPVRTRTTYRGRLIAAAPELLAATVEVREEIARAIRNAGACRNLIPTLDLWASKLAVAIAKAQDGR